MPAIRQPRIFVEWDSGAWVVSTHPEFQAEMAAFVKQYGPPSRVEFRNAGEFYVADADKYPCPKPPTL